MGGAPYQQLRQDAHAEALLHHGLRAQKVGLILKLRHGKVVELQAVVHREDGEEVLTEQGITSKASPAGQQEKPKSTMPL